MQIKDQSPKALCHLRIRRNEDHRIQRVNGTSYALNKSFDKKALYSEQELLVVAQWLGRTIDTFQDWVQFQDTTVDGGLGNVGDAEPDLLTSAWLE